MTLCQVPPYLGFEQLRGVDKAYDRKSQIWGPGVRRVKLNKISPFRKDISFLKSSATLVFGVGFSKHGVRNLSFKSIQREKDRLFFKEDGL
jgi:hypothetical protein